jgi:2-polyprenyl-3-methyl-5-hydroxy-6-metoxy-1,4-benzoquinol methylase
MLTDTETKQTYFNRYWQTRDLPSADARSMQRAELTRSLLGEPYNADILEVGCGRGTVLTHLSDAGYNITGCDISSQSVADLVSIGADVFLCDIEHDDLPANYNVILCLEVLQQIFDPVAALSKCARHLTDGGFMVVSVPNEFHLVSRLKLLFGSSHLGHFGESHIRLFTPRRAREMFAAAGLRVEKVIPVSIIPPRLRWLNAFGRLLAKLSPGLFSLSQIYRVRQQ